MRLNLEDTGVLYYPVFVVQLYLYYYVEILTVRFVTLGEGAKYDFYCMYTLFLCKRIQESYVDYGHSIHMAL